MPLGITRFCRPAILQPLGSGVSATQTPGKMSVGTAYFGSLWTARHYLRDLVADRRLACHRRYGGLQAGKVLGACGDDQWIGPRGVPGPQH